MVDETDEYITREDAMWAACKALCHPGVLCPDNYCIEVRKVFDAIPAADVAPVVRGRWIESYSGWTPTKKCSACGVHFTQFPMKTVVKGEPIKPVLNFCPACGAKMEVQNG